MSCSAPNSTSTSRAASRSSSSRSPHADLQSTTELAVTLPAAVVVSDPKPLSRFELMQARFEALEAASPLSPQSRAKHTQEYEHKMHEDDQEEDQEDQEAGHNPYEHVPQQAEELVLNAFERTPRRDRADADNADAIVGAEPALASMPCHNTVPPVPEEKGTQQADNDNDHLEGGPDAGSALLTRAAQISAVSQTEEHESYEEAAAAPNVGEQDPKHDPEHNVSAEDDQENGDDDDDVHVRAPGLDQDIARADLAPKPQVIINNDDLQDEDSEALDLSAFSVAPNDVSYFHQYRTVDTIPEEDEDDSLTASHTSVRQGLTPDRAIVATKLVEGQSLGECAEDEDSTDTEVTARVRMLND